MKIFCKEDTVDAAEVFDVSKPDSDLEQNCELQKNDFIINRQVMILKVKNNSYDQSKATKIKAQVLSK